MVDLTTSKYIWLDRSQLGEITNVPSNDLLPIIQLPLSTSPVGRLLSLCRIALKHNYISSLLVIAGGVLALHYKTLTKVYAGCPVVVCVGPSETGKSTAIKAALSLFGMCFNSLVNCDCEYTMSTYRVTIHGDICEGDKCIFLGAGCHILTAILY